MVFTHIPSPSLENKEKIEKLNQHIRKGNPAFVLIYMEGCGPCNATRPEWGKLENVLSRFQKDENVMIADVNEEVLPQLKSIKKTPVGYPTILYIQGDLVKDYEEDRSIDAFVKWIRSKYTNVQKGGKKSRMVETKRRKIKRKSSKNTKNKSRKSGKSGKSGKSRKMSKK